MQVSYTDAWWIFDWFKERSNDIFYEGSSGGALSELDGYHISSLNYSFVWFYRDESDDIVTQFLPVSWQFDIFFSRLLAVLCNPHQFHARVNIPTTKLLLSYGKLDKLVWTVWSSTTKTTVLICIAMALQIRAVRNLLKAGKQVSSSVCIITYFK